MDTTNRALLGLAAVTVLGGLFVWLALAIGPSGDTAPSGGQVAGDEAPAATPAAESEPEEIPYGDGVDPVDEYAARFNVPQAIAAPTPEDDWGGEGWLFVAAEVGRGVSVFDVKTLQPIRFLYSPDSPVPHHPYISPDQRWVIANARFGSEVMVIDTHNDFAQTFLEFPEGEDGDVAGPLHGTYTSDSSRFLVALQRSNRLGVVDLTSDEPRIEEVIDIGRRPRDIYITPDDSRAFISLQSEAYAAVVDIGTWDVRQIQTSDNDYSQGTGGGGGMSVDGSLFGVSNTPDNEVVIIDTESEEVTHRISDVPDPVNLEFLGTTHRVGTGNRSDGSVTFIDGDSGELLATTKTGGGTNIPQLGPDGRYWVTHNADAHIAVIDPETFEVVDEIGTGQSPHWLYFTPNGRHAFASNWGEASVSLVDTVDMTEIAKLTSGLNPNGMAIKTDITPEEAQAARDAAGEAEQEIQLASTMVLPEPRTESEELFLNTCTQCHDIGRIVRSNARGDEWEAIVHRMRGNGAQMTDEEMDEIIAYLADAGHADLEVGTEYDEQQ
jgi:DNA-binding beta-propeller fold protein YncE